MFGIFFKSPIYTFTAKHRSDGNFKPFCTFSDFMQMFKVEKFAS